MRIGSHEIKDYGEPYIVAEISGNHNGSLPDALELVARAKDAGANAVKLQCYKAETITLNHNSDDFKIKRGPWKGRRLYDLYKEAQTPWEWFPILFQTAANSGLDCFSSVFDEEGACYLTNLNCPAYKIASFDIVDIPLIKHLVKTGRPLIISTGMASDDEINDADSAIPADYPHCFLHCISGYPTPVGEAKLLKINDLRRLGVPVGLSDHTMGSDVPVAATALGICMLEKHITLDRRRGGPDDHFSLTPDEFAAMASKVRYVWQGLWTRMKDGHDLSTVEDTSRPYRKSLYVVKDVPQGGILDSSNVRPIRPAYGLPPKYWDAVVGRRARRALTCGSPLSWGDVEDADGGVL